MSNKAQNESLFFLLWLSASLFDIFNLVPGYFYWLLHFLAVVLAACKCKYFISLRAALYDQINHRSVMKVRV